MAGQPACARLLRARRARVPSVAVHGIPSARPPLGVFLRRAVIWIVVLVLLAGCSGGRDEQRVRLPPTPVVSLRPTWAVVTVPYLRLRESASAEAGIAGHLRRGEVARILAVSTVAEQIDGERHLWFQLEAHSASGWALDMALESYGSEERARNAAQRLHEE